MQPKPTYSQFKDLLEKIKLIQSKDRPIIQYKRKLIDKLLERFLLHNTVRETIHEDVLDFGIHLKDLSLKLPELLPELLKDALSSKSDPPLKDLLLIANLKYIPPREPARLIHDLLMLHSFWSMWPASRILVSKEALNRALEGDYSSANRELFEGFDDILDLSLTKLAYRVAFEISGIHHWGRRDFNRTLRSAQKRREKAK
jgi:hypothetical protein